MSKPNKFKRWVQDIYRNATTGRTMKKSDMTPANRSMTVHEKVMREAKPRCLKCEKGYLYFAYAENENGIEKFRYYCTLCDAMATMMMDSDLSNMISSLIPSGGSFKYGDSSGTIHHTGEINVELRNNQVVSVWFRCMMLPFTETQVEAVRALEMCGAYKSDILPKIINIEVTKKD